MAITENTTIGEIVKGVVRGVMTGVGYPLAAASAGILTPQIIAAVQDNLATLAVGVVVAGIAHIWSATSKLETK